MYRNNALLIPGLNSCIYVLLPICAETLLKIGYRLMKAITQFHTAEWLAEAKCGFLGFSYHIKTFENIGKHMCESN